MTVCSAAPWRLVLQFWCRGKEAKESSVLVIDEWIAFVFTPYCVNASVKNPFVLSHSFCVTEPKLLVNLFLYNIHFITFYRIKLVSIKYARLLVLCYSNHLVADGDNLPGLCLRKHLGWAFGVNGEKRARFQRWPLQCDVPSCSAFLNNSPGLYSKQMLAVKHHRAVNHWTQECFQRTMKICKCWWENGRGLDSEPLNRSSRCVYNMQLRYFWYFV